MSSYSSDNDSDDTTPVRSGGATGSAGSPSGCPDVSPPAGSNTSAQPRPMPPAGSSTAGQPRPESFMGGGGY